MSPAAGRAASAGPSVDHGALIERIEQCLLQATNGPVTVRQLELLAGGACQDLYRLELTFSSGPLAGERRMVLRSDAPRSLPGSLGRKDEFAVIEAAISRGVKTPAVYWLSQGVVRDGAWAYFMDWVDGTAIGRQVVKGAAQQDTGRMLGALLAQELARIHTISAITHPDLFPERDRLERTDPVGAALAGLRESMDRLPSPRPALELVFSWLDTHRPAALEVTLVHGDFRTGNFMLTPAGLSGVLDWEFSHFSSPAVDLAWIAVRDWRFNVLDKPIGGFCDRASFYRAYSAASSRKLSPELLHWCEILGNARWAAGAVHQGQRYLEQPDLELIAIARRAAEMEWEALRLIERGPADVH